MTLQRKGVAFRICKEPFERHQKLKATKFAFPQNTQLVLGRVNFLTVFKSLKNQQGLDFGPG